MKKLIKNFLVTLLFLFVLNYSYAYWYTISDDTTLPNETITNLTFENFEEEIFDLGNSKTLTFLQSTTFFNNVIDKTIVGTQESLSASDTVYGNIICNDSGIISFNETSLFNQNEINLHFTGGNLTDTDTDTTDVCAYAKAYSYGGLMYNGGTNATITFDNITKFTNNTVEAIATGGNIRIQNGNIDTTANVYADGGVIYNMNTIMNFSDVATFTDNTLTAVATAGSAGMISVEASSTGFNVDVSADVKTYGGVIYNMNTIMNFSDVATFTDNTLTATATAAFSSRLRPSSRNKGSAKVELYGGVLYNESSNENIVGAVTFDKKATFNSNKIEVSATGGGVFGNCSTKADIDVKGGVVYNNGENLTVTFLGESEFKHNSIVAAVEGGNTKNDRRATAKIYGGVIYNNEGTLIFKEKSAFSDNTLTATITGGAASSSDQYILNSAAYYGSIVYNTGAITFNDEVIFENNVVIAEDNREHYSGPNTNKYDLYSLGCIYNDGKIIFKNSAIFSGNSGEFSSVDTDERSEMSGGAIYNSTGEITFEDGASFINNKATYGGAIYNCATINLIARTSNVEFTGNQGYGEAIYNEDGIINLWTKSKDETSSKEYKGIIFNDTIAGSGTININKTSSENNPTNGVVYLNANMNGYLGVVNLYNGTVKLGEYNRVEEVLQETSEEGTKEVNHGSWFENAVVVVENGTIDMTNAIMQEINFKELKIINPENTLYLVADVDLEKAVMDTINIERFQGDGEINVKKFNVFRETDRNKTVVKFITSSDENIINELDSHVFLESDKIQTMHYEYDVSYEDGNMIFTKSKMLRVPKDMNEIVEVGAYIMQSNIINEAFTSMEQQKERYGQNKEKYGIFSGVWLRPFAMKENVKLAGFDADTDSYGTLAGIDWEVGTKEMLSVYVGVAGSKITKESLDVNQLGYTVGASLTYIEDNWYVGVTANVGTNKATIKDDKGQDEYNMLLWTVGAKAAYEIDISQKLSLEPMLLAWYGNSNSEKYTSTRLSDREIGARDWKNIQVEPILKAKLNLDYGWMPYAFLGYAFNLGDKGTESVDRQVDEMGDGGYAEGGIGIHKDFQGTRLSIYGQVLGRAGAREGYGGNIGIKYRIGKSAEEKALERQRLQEEAERKLQEEAERLRIEEEIKSKEDVRLKEISEKEEIEYVTKGIKLNTKPQFEFAKAELTKESKNKDIDKLVEELSQINAKSLIIEGHGDKIGSNQVNDKLSRQRAQVIANILRKDYGIKTKFGIIGAGKRFPIATNETKEGRAKNRRVEITVIPE